MYVPCHFALSETLWRDLLAEATTGQLVTAHERGPVATLLPLHYRPAGAGLGSFVAHVSRTNSQWKEPHLGQVLVIVSGPDHYIDPEWIPSFAEGRVGVPTWNYVTVHAYGDLIVHDDPAWTAAAVTDLSARHDFDLSTADQTWVARMLPAVVGIEMVISSVEAKAKLSQNRTPDDIRALIAALNGEGATAIAGLMEAVSVPHAEARDETVGEARRRYAGPAG